MPLRNAASRSIGANNLAEFVLYLTKSDADFEQFYLRETRAWF